jgi:hypothetical protein
MKRFWHYAGRIVVLGALVWVAGTFFMAPLWKLPIYWMDQHNTDHRSLFAGKIAIAAAGTTAISGVTAGESIHSLCLSTSMASAAAGSVQVVFKDEDNAVIDSLCVKQYADAGLATVLFCGEVTRDVETIVVRQFQNTANFWWMGLSDDE